MVRDHPQDANVLDNEQLSQHYSDWFVSLKDAANEGEIPQPTQEIIDTVGVQIPSPVNNLMVRIKSDGGAVDITANPQISSGFDGQVITLEGMDDTDTVQLDDGDGLKLAGGASFTISNNDVISLHYNAAKDLWIENTRSQN